MTETAIDVRTIPAMTYGEAMDLAEVASARMVDAVSRLEDDDWAQPTDCEGWDVKALLSHVAGEMQGCARPPTFVRQYLAAMRASKRSGRHMIDEMTAAQVRDHAALTPAELVQRLRDLGPRAVRGRRRMPGFLRALPIKPGEPFTGSWTLGYLLGTIINRDTWMHRVDLTRTTGTELVLTADHDGRIVADVVAEWARTHGQPFMLTLDGPAGGTFTQGSGGEDLRLDAVELCRILSGRGTGTGLLTQEVPF